MTDEEEEVATTLPEEGECLRASSSLSLSSMVASILFLSAFSPQLAATTHSSLLVHLSKGVQKSVWGPN